MKADKVFSNPKGQLQAAEVNTKAGTNCLLLTSGLGCEETYRAVSHLGLSSHLPTGYRTETYFTILLLTEPFHHLCFYCLI